jgi:hypothetical protein
MVKILLSDVKWTVHFFCWPSDVVFCLSIYEKRDRSALVELPHGWVELRDCALTLNRCWLYVIVAFVRLMTGCVVLVA